MTNGNAPLSEADRLAERYSVDEVREYLSFPPVVDGHRHHKDIDRLAFLLNLIGVLEGQLATAREELEQQRYCGEQLQMSIESCSGNHDDALGLDGGGSDE